MPTNFRLGVRGSPPTRTQLNSHGQRIVWPAQQFTPPPPPDEDGLLDWQSIQFYDHNGDPLFDWNHA